MANIIASKLDADQITRLSFDEANSAMKTIGVGGSLVPQQYDEISLTYVAAGNGVGEIETATYKLNSVTIATLTLSYNVANKLINVVRS